ncbi:AmmeMemoRadiSam system protein B [Dankookia rubra]|nr:AmmeMemoRadiSam system protein B [Dankookia rubra]
MNKSWSLSHLEQNHGFRTVAIGFIAFLACMLEVNGYAQADSSSDNYLPHMGDRATIERAINLERPSFEPPVDVTGISVPHHLLAADLIARGFWAASKGSYERVILISPDHYRSVKGRFGVINSDFKTIFGQARHDHEVVERLLMQPELFEPLRQPEREHGIQAVVPFIRFFFPSAEIIAVAAAVTTDPSDWIEVASALTPFLTKKTLVVQSTDYSHYLPLAEAIRRDRQTLAVLSTGNVDVVGSLTQPSHLDSKAAQAVQMHLQSHLGASQILVGNRNSAQYTKIESSTTSYLVSVFLKDPNKGGVFRYADQSVFYFGGDVLLGRFLAPMVAKESVAAEIVSEIMNHTQGAPLVVNLEGVLLPDPIVGLGSNTHQMLAKIAAPILRRLNVVAAGLANNHSLDFGPAGLQETIEQLEIFGIKPLVHGSAVNMGMFRLVALNLLPGQLSNEPAGAGFSAASKLLCDLAADPPLVAFVHWGKEYTSVPTLNERAYGEALQQCGVSLIVGAHTHQASAQLETIGRGETQILFSLGNLIFDQIASISSAALLEVRIFEQGTIAARLVKLPNIFETAKNAFHREPASSR